MATCLQHVVWCCTASSSAYLSLTCTLNVMSSLCAVEQASESRELSLAVLARKIWPLLGETIIFCLCIGYVQNASCTYMYILQPIVIKSWPINISTSTSSCNARATEHAMTCFCVWHYDMAQFSWYRHRQVNSCIAAWVVASV